MYKQVILVLVVGAIGYALYVYLAGGQTRTGPQMNFDGTGYTTFGAGSDYDVMKTHFSIDFKTTAATGVLMYAKAEDKDYFMASLVDGKVMVEFDMGGGSFPLMSPKVVNNGLWHSISVQRDKRDVTLTVDGEPISTTSPTGNNSVSRPSVVYVGGTTVATYDKFRGCMRNISFNDRFNMKYDYTVGGVTLGCIGQ